LDNNPKSTTEFRSQPKPLWIMPNHSRKFHQSPFTIFEVIQLTERQTENRQTHKLTDCVT